MPIVGAAAYIAWIGVRSVVPSEPRMCSALYETSRSTLAIVYFTAAMSVRHSCVEVVERDAHLVVDDVVVVPRLGLDLHTGRLARHDEHAVRAHDEEDVGDAPRAREPLLAVDDPLVAVLGGVGPEQVRVRAALRL